MEPALHRPRPISESDRRGSSEVPSAGKRHKRTSCSGRLTPGFWNRLSSIRLTRRALDEFDRRFSVRKKSLFKRPTSVKPLSEPGTLRLERFSRHGGPDLTHLRGFTIKDARDYTMSPSRAGRKPESIPDGGDDRRKSKSTYDANFEQNMIDSGIYPAGYQHDDTQEQLEPKNIDEIRRTLREPRASLCESQFSVHAFRDFRIQLVRARDEAKARAEILSVVAGEKGKEHYNASDRLFNNLEPLDKHLPTPKPDFYDGAQPSSILPTVRYELKDYIVPCTNTSLPAAPNFFVEAKGLSGRPDVGTRQACYDGALGARVMYCLQNYKLPEANYDGNAYSFSCTWYDGFLRLYAHYPSPPTTPDQPQRYHMTRLAGYDMTNDAHSFREGAAAFRNLRDHAKTVRDKFIKEVNQRVATGHQETSQASPAGSVSELQDRSEVSADDPPAE
ncbi:hypothetical protein AYL99_03112 [Fonsecaea erecta]|uniref:DUF7924 domain-containing protein n=1 Tax=Fonsecaea erecta TaxID=1367422 RepID=A0A178ZXZ6_9EURO|nr:hypothetical protein AYL99_03112 [Fonsecaea erecta]OAP63885.1 hypothetical protein AYL99_03112 [Fonsecaea erecta]